MPPADGGRLGSALVGEKIMINSRHIAVTKLLGEGGFSYVYLVKEMSDTAAGQSLNNTVHVAGATGSGSGSGVGRSTSFGKDGPTDNKDKGTVSSGGSNSQHRRSIGNSEANEKKEMVLKVTAILSRQQRDIAEKEAKLLSRLSHPSIIKMYDTCYRTVPASSGGVGGAFRSNKSEENKERPQHLILMEFCEGGHALDVCTKLAANGERFDLSTLIIAFGQICNAVSYLHAQRPPIVHRDLKPANFLVKNGAYKLCDFGSAVFGHVDLKTPKARAEAEEVIQKTTTQMFRAPEMVDLYMAKKLTQATDVWALGCCLYSMAFLQNCFEEGSNLAILSRKYKIPDDNPYGDGLIELIDRMLTIDSKARCDMTEVILCLSAVYSGRPLPPRKERSSKSKKEKEGGSSKDKVKKKKNEKAGTFRTTAQGIYEEDLAIDPEEVKKQPVQAKKLDPNSAAARRRLAAGGSVGDMEFASFHSKFDEAAAQNSSTEVDPDLAFSTTANPFAAFENSSSKNNYDEAGAGVGGVGSSGDQDVSLFESFHESDKTSLDSEVLNAFEKSQVWGHQGEGFPTSTAPAAAAAARAPDPPIAEGTEEEEADDSGGGQTPRRRRSSGPSSRRAIRSSSSGNSDHSAGEAGDGQHEQQSSSKSKHRQPRPRSNSRRTSRSTSSGKQCSDMDEMAEAVKDMHTSSNNDEGAQQPTHPTKGAKTPTRRARGKVRRTKSGSEGIKDASDSLRRSIAGASRSPAHSRETPHRSSSREDAPRARTMSAGGD